MSGSSVGKMVRGGCLFAVAATLMSCDQASPPVEKPPSAQTQSSERAEPAVQYFEERAQSAQLKHTHFSGVSGKFLFPEILGAGVALFDYDNDNDLDIYLAQGSSIDPATPASEFLFPSDSNQPVGGRLYQNQLSESSELTFIDVTEKVGINVQGHGMGAATGDIDNDGDTDLYLTMLERNVLYRNNGDGSFTDITTASGAATDNWSTSASFFDMDNDGDLDLYVTAYVTYRLDLDKKCTSNSGNRDYCGPQNYQNARDYLFENSGSGKFKEVGESWGVNDVRGAGLGVIAADFDNNGYADLFVANDGEANYFWMNENGRGFTENGLMSGTAYNRDGSAEASMGVAAADFDGDGDEDLFMSHLINETNTLYRNNGSGDFIDVSDTMGLGSGSKPFTGFGIGQIDIDNDGWLDLYIANGDVKVEERQSDVNRYPFDQRNQLFRNHDGRQFLEVVSKADAAVASSMISRGVAIGDINNDGFTDMVVTNNSGPVQLFINQAASDANWISLKLQGTESNRDAIGARVAIEISGGRTLWRRVHTDGSYLSANDKRLHIGLGKSSAINRIVVHWPSGLKEEWRDVPLNETSDLVEHQGTPIE